VSKPTVIEEVFAAVQRVAPDLTVYVAYCSEPAHKDVPQLSNSADRFCSMCGAEIKGQPYQPDAISEKGAA
jgi:hypothetical protein